MQINIPKVHFGVSCCVKTFFLNIIYYIVLYCIMLYYIIISCYVMLCYMLCYVMLCYVMLCPLSCFLLHEMRYTFKVICCWTYGKEPLR